MSSIPQIARNYYYIILFTNLTGIHRCITSVKRPVMEIPTRVEHKLLSLVHHHSFHASSQFMSHGYCWHLSGTVITTWVTMTCDNWTLFDPVTVTVWGKLTNGGKLEWRGPAGDECVLTGDVTELAKQIGQSTTEHSESPECAYCTLHGTNYVCMSARHTRQNNETASILVVPPSVFSHQTSDCMLLSPGR